MWRNAVKRPNKAPIKKAIYKKSFAGVVLINISIILILILIIVVIYMLKTPNDTTLSIIGLIIAIVGAMLYFYFLYKKTIIWIQNRMKLKYKKIIRKL